MNGMKVSFLVSLFLLSGLWACGGSSGGGPKAALEKLHAACKAENHKEAAGFVAYTLRKDRERRYKDTLSVENEDELRSVKKICARVQEKMSGDFEITKQKKKKESEGTWHVIFFTSNGDEGAFAFLEHGDSFMLGDID